MDERPAARVAARITAVAGVVIAVVGLVLVLGAPGSAPPPQAENAADGIGTAFRTIVGGVLLVMAGLAGIAAVVLWLLAERRARRLR